MPIFDCDASGAGFGAKLHQDVGPFTIFSHPFTVHHLKLAAYKCELIGLMQAMCINDLTCGGTISSSRRITTAASFSSISAFPPCPNISGSASYLALILLWSTTLAA
jgi:hypothetical protein